MDQKAKYTIVVSTRNMIGSGLMGGKYLVFFKVIRAIPKANSMLMVVSMVK